MSGSSSRHPRIDAPVPAEPAREEQAPRGAPPARESRAKDARPPREDARKILGVADANKLVRALLEGSLPPLWIAGEVSNLRRPTSGHVYLTLKDKDAQLKGVIWRNTAARIPFRIEDGMEVVCLGRITVYEPRGEYQIAIDQIEPKGIGAQQLALEQLKRKLEAEGLFDPARKRPLPAFPVCIALVTSVTGAAVRDIMEVIDRRFPKLRVILVSVRVQGDGAAREVERAIDLVSDHGQADVMIVGRGGGSAEDLWAFNDEGVARAIARCRVPVISSVGHAIDTTVADLVADRRALTPTEAAELATPLLAGVLEELEGQRERLKKALMRAVKTQRERLDLLARSYVFREPAEQVRRHVQRLDDLGARLPREVRRRVEALRERLGWQAGALEGLSPLGVLARGYSVTSRAGELHALRDASEVKPGDRLRTRLSRGEIVSEVVGGEVDHGG